ncbi:MAG: hypothetical protein FWC33_02720 [Candidatus Bathyarchaeota archaeon]|nr:hypothetical protein [Candidatus Termiticorpusculum sp.]
MNNSIRKKLSKCKILTDISGFFNKHYNRVKTAFKIRSTTGSGSNPKEAEED